MYSQPPTSADSQTWTGHIIFSQHFVKSEDVTPVEDPLYLLEKNLHVSGPLWFKAMLFKDQLCTGFWEERSSLLRLNAEIYIGIKTVSFSDSRNKQVNFKVILCSLFHL